MNFVFTDEQLQFKETIKSFLAQECTPESIRLGWKENSPFNQKRWDDLISLGVIGSNLSEEDGGLGVDQVALTLMIEEMGYSGLPEPVAEQNFLINDLTLFNIPTISTSISCFNCRKIIVYFFKFFSNSFYMTINGSIFNISIFPIGNIH